MGSSSSDSSQQQFCLRWHNYQTSLLATLPQLLDGEDLTDVTLCAGGRTIKAHRIVLSACSQYFKQLFRELQPLQHPVIVLPGAEFTDLCALVTFMYSGEVNIYQQQLAGLLNMADTLHIRGLAEFTPDSERKEVNESNRYKRAKLSDGGPRSSSSNSGAAAPGYNSSPTTEPANPYKTMYVQKQYKRKGPTWRQQQIADEEAEDLSKRHSENTSNTAIGVAPCTPTPPINNATSAATTPPPTPGSQDSAAPTSANLSPFPQEPQQGDTNLASTQPVQGSGVGGGGGGGGGRAQSKLYAMCFVCGKLLSNQYNLRVHMETHQNAHYACSSCSHVSRSRDALRKHVSYRHPPPQQQPQLQQGATTTAAAQPPPSQPPESKNHAT